MALCVAAASALAAAWAAALLESVLWPEGARMAAGLALLLGAARLAWRPRGRLPAEPTRSLGALALVLFFRQLADPARLIVAALVLAGIAPGLAAWAGILGSAAALARAWARGESIAPRRVSPASRFALAFVLVAIAVLVALDP